MKTRANEKKKKKNIDKDDDNNNNDMDKEIINDGAADTPPSSSSSSSSCNPYQSTIMNEERQQHKTTFYYILNSKFDWRGKKWRGMMDNEELETKKEEEEEEGGGGGGQEKGGEKKKLSCSRSTIDDDTMNRYIDIIKNFETCKTKTAESYYLFNRYEVKDGYLYNKMKGTRLIPLGEIFDQIFESHMSTGHGGEKRTFHDLKTRGIANISLKYVGLFVSTCKICLKKRTSKPSSFSSSDSIITPIISSNFGERGQVDLIDMSSFKTTQHRYILNYQDHFSKFCIIRPLINKHVSSVVKELIDIFSIIGCPKILQSDNGLEFKFDAELKKIWPRLRIVHGRPRHPQSQGSVERANQDIEQIMRCWLADNNTTNWVKGLPFIQMQKNNALNRTIGFSPFFAVFGKNMSINDNFTMIDDNNSNNNDDNGEDEDEEGCFYNINKRKRRSGRRVRGGGVVDDAKDDDDYDDYDGGGGGKDDDDDDDFKETEIVVTERDDGGGGGGGGEGKDDDDDGEEEEEGDAFVKLQKRKEYGEENVPHNLNDNNNNNNNGDIVHICNENDCNINNVDDDNGNYYDENVVVIRVMEEEEDLRGNDDANSTSNNDNINSSISCYDRVNIFNLDGNSKEEEKIRGGDDDDDKEKKRGNEETIVKDSSSNLIGSGEKISTDEWVIWDLDDNNAVVVESNNDENKRKEREGEEGGGGGERKKMRQNDRETEMFWNNENVNVVVVVEEEEFRNDDNNNNNFVAVGNQKIINTNNNNVVDLNDDTVTGDKRKMIIETQEAQGNEAKRLKKTTTTQQIEVGENHRGEEERKREKEGDDDEEEEEEKDEAAKEKENKYQRENKEECEKEERRNDCGGGGGDDHDGTELLSSFSLSKDNVEKDEEDEKKKEEEEEEEMDGKKRDHIVVVVVDDDMDNDEQLPEILFEQKQMEKITTGSGDNSGEYEVDKINQDDYDDNNIDNIQVGNSTKILENVRGQISANIKKEAQRIIAIDKNKRGGLDDYEETTLKPDTIVTVKIPKWDKQHKLNFDNIICRVVEYLPKIRKYKLASVETNIVIKNLFSPRQIKECKNYKPINLLRKSSNNKKNNNNNDKQQQQQQQRRQQQNKKKNNNMNNNQQDQQPQQQQLELPLRSVVMREQSLIFASCKCISFCDSEKCPCKKAKRKCVPGLCHVKQNKKKVKCVNK